MKRLYFFSTLRMTCMATFGQSFSGYRAGNYTGVNGVFFNPANIADSRYRFDLNFLTMNSMAGNNQATFNLRRFNNPFVADSGDTRAALGRASGMAEADVHGLSLMFNASKKVAIALTTRARAMTNVVDIDGRLLDRVIDDMVGNTELPYHLASRNNMRVNVNAWSELGLSVATVLADRDMYFFKGGVSLKYLRGAANAYLQVSDLNATVNQDLVNNEPYFANTTGTMALGFGGMRFNNVSNHPRSITSSGFGGDIGFVYEFRPDYEAYRLSGDEDRRDMNKYKFKIGVAVLDIGGIKYDKDMKRTGSYKIDIRDSERVYLDRLSGTNVDDLKDSLDNMPEFFTPDKSNTATGYLVSLPTTLHIDLDYHLARGFYVNLASQFALTDSRTNSFNSHYYHAFTVTPRFEGRAVGIYVPLNYNELTSFNAGVSLRVGPFFAGSGSLLTAVFDESKQADFHFGVRIGGLQKNTAKSKSRDKQLQEDYRRSQGR